MKKRWLTFSLLTTMAVGLNAAIGRQLVFTLHDGTTRSIAATGLSLDFSNGNLTAKNGEASLTIPLTSLKKMAFADGDATGIDNVNVNVNDNVNSDGESGVYDLQGHKMNGKGMRKGVYVVKTKSKTYKKIVK